LLSILEISASRQSFTDMIKERLKYLKENEFIKLHTVDGKEDEYMPTQLGSACLTSSLSPDEGIIVFKELQKARKCFVLENDLHVIYQVKISNN